MRLLYKNSYEISSWKLAFWCVAAFVVLTLYNGASNVWFYEGYELTISGTIQVHELEYSKRFNYDYTEVSLRTYAESSHHFHLLGHHKLEVGKTYTITYERTSPLGHHQFMIRKVIEIEELS